MTNPDQTPAEGIGVVVNPGQVQGNTDANGLARLTINTEETSQPLTIMVFPQSMHMCENTTLHVAKNGNNPVIFVFTCINRRWLMGVDFLMLFCPDNTLYKSDFFF